MSNRNASRSTLFLMELVMVVFMFALCGAVCLGLFATSQKMTDESDSLNHAVAISRTAAGCYKAADGDLRETLHLMSVPGTLTDTGSAAVYYDAAWSPVAAPAEKGFCLEIQSISDSAAALQAADITVYDADREPVFHIQVKKATAGTGGELHGIQ